MLYKIRKKHLDGYLYILPIFIIITCFYIIPIFMSFGFSFTKYSIIKSPEFIGLNNYKRLLQDSIFITALKNTIYFTLAVVPIQTILSLLLAIWITSRKKSKWMGFVKGALFIPVISSMILVSIVWRIILNSDTSFLNQIFHFLGMQSPNWLGNSKLALLSIIIISVWKNVGYFMVIYVAAILDIPQYYYEAAVVDGANKLHKFMYITIPILMPTTLLVVVLGTIWSFQIFDLVYSLTGGGPGFSTMTLVLHIYNASFKQFDMGYGMTLAYVLFFIVALISIIQIKFLKKEEGIY